MTALTPLVRWNICLEWFTHAYAYTRLLMRTMYIKQQVPSTSTARLITDDLSITRATHYLHLGLRQDLL
jgi:hypothetical protein